MTRARSDTGGKLVENGEEMWHPSVGRCTTVIERGRGR
jgi:hypothetical protein